MDLCQPADVTVSMNCSLRTAGEGDRVGRQTGFLAWRLACRELDQPVDLTVSMNCSLRTAGEGDRVGRQTGSLAWRLAGGEQCQQCCGSGSGRIRNFLPDPDPDYDPESIISDPDPE